MRKKAQVPVDQWQRWEKPPHVICVIDLARNLYTFYSEKSSFCDVGIWLQ
jgi:hypothetical protein